MLFFCDDANARSLLTFPFVVLGIQSLERLSCYKQPASQGKLCPSIIHSYLHPSIQPSNQPTNPTNICPSSINVSTHPNIHAFNQTLFCSSMHPPSTICPSVCLSNTHLHSENQSWNHLSIGLGLDGSPWCICVCIWKANRILAAPSPPILYHFCTHVQLWPWVFQSKCGAYVLLLCPNRLVLVYPVHFTCSHSISLL